MTARVSIQPAVLQWALDRSERSPEMIHQAFPKIESWANGEPVAWTNLEKLAAFCRVPIGALFASKPASETLPIPDFRTVGGRTPSPSANLLDTLYWAQTKQTWYTGYASRQALEPVDFVGTAALATPPKVAAASLHKLLDLDVVPGVTYRTDTMKVLRDRLEGAGVLVLTNGVVGGNTHRKLDPNDFRGFALVDNLAPLVFITGTDSGAAKLFTLAHEVGHLLLGKGGVDNPAPGEGQGQIEAWCNAFAAELLVPEADFAHAISGQIDTATSVTPEKLETVAGRYQVSTLVILARLREIGIVSTTEYWPLFRQEQERIEAILETLPKRTPGGAFETTQPARLGRRLTRAVLSDTFEGGTHIKDAMRLIGTRKYSSLRNLAEHVGLVA